LEDDVTSVFADLKAVLSCGCRVCTRHGEVHAQVPRVLLGATVHVDAELAPLLDALAGDGVMTVASCVDWADATARLWPASLPHLLATRGRPSVHYGQVVADRLAFVRLIDGPKAAPFLRAVEARGGVVTRDRPLVQAAFPRRLLAEMGAV
jgi:hypothetical protein